MKMIDQERATKVAGNSFVYLKGDLVFLDMAIQRFALDFLRRKGFEIVYPPLMINKTAYQGMIGNPFDFMEASYKLEGEDLFLQERGLRRRTGHREMARTGLAACGAVR